MGRGGLGRDVLRPSVRASVRNAKKGSKRAPESSKKKHYLEKVLASRFRRVGKPYENLSKMKTFGVPASQKGKGMCILNGVRDLEI